MMKLARVAGVPIILSQNWFVFVLVMTFMTFFKSGLMSTVNTVLVMLFLTLFVILHE